MIQVQIGMDEVLAMTAEEHRERHQAFLDKFKPKLTTDDCYTPEPIYEAIAGWVAEEYNVDPGKFVRPFWPGADYKSHVYHPGCVVVDNPPFSILAEIVNFFTRGGHKVFPVRAGADAVQRQARGRVIPGCRVHDCVRKRGGG